jgi:hypothetical protein
MKNATRRRHEGAAVRVQASLLELVGHECPQAEDEEGGGDDPGQDARRHERGEPGPDRAGEEVIGECRCEDAQHDRAGALELGGEDERQQLRLVAHFGECDESGGDEQGFQGGPR